MAPVDFHARIYGRARRLIARGKTPKNYIGIRNRDGSDQARQDIQRLRK